MSVAKVMESDDDSDDSDVGDVGDVGESITGEIEGASEEKTDTTENIVDASTDEE